MSHTLTAFPKGENIPADKGFHYTPQPGAIPYDKALIGHLARMQIKRGPSYHPRTKYLRPDGRAKYYNRLFLESSPYLLQHAHNPVDWYPWGDEAFDTAKKLNRPVFLSIGYSTCHWCHVMEKESFEDEEIARYLNEHYICIKVDREERPDIDAVYMAAVQALTGRGGWPLSAWLTPDRKPFYGGTYFPARDGDRGAAIGFLTILKKLNKSFHESDGRAQKAAAQVTAAVRQIMASKPSSRLFDREILKDADQFYRQSYDPEFGGLAGAPKFPSSLPVRFLLREYRRTGDQQILEMVTHSLSKMAAGGMYDHVGGGFHRYSTDERWLVPHFEKMLYDNALLAVSYLEAWQVTGNMDFKRVVDEILAYVTRDMTSSDGAFYSATDADSKTPEGRMEEGWYFTWTPEEIESVLGKTDGAIIEKYYGVGRGPDFEGRCILHVPKSIVETAADLDISETKLADIIDASRKKLYAARSRRQAPFRDEKILTAWNALMISAYARAGLAFDNPAYTKQAERTARFILDHLYIDHKLYRSFKDGKAQHDAYLEDYAFLIAAMLDLYESDHRIQWLKTALELDGILKADYEDTENGGFFATGIGHETLIAREKPCYDSAVPSGNSVAALNLLRLYSFTTDYEFRQRAENLFKAFSGQLHATPSALSEMLTAIVFYLDRPEEIIIITPHGNPGAAKKFIDTFRSRFVPDRILIVADESQAADHAKIIPLIRDKKALRDKATAYVCKGGTCLRPTCDPEIFAHQIR